MVESIFRMAKTILETRPIYHKCDATVRGHVFCSVLALAMRQELQKRLTDKGLVVEWADVLRDLEALRMVRLQSGGSLCELRTVPQGAAGKVLLAVGVSSGPSARFLEQ